MFYLYLVFVIFVIIIVMEVFEFFDWEYGNLFFINIIEFWEYLIVKSLVVVYYFVVLKVFLFF